MPARESAPPSPRRLRLSSTTRRRVLGFLLIFIVAAGVRLLTYNFMRTHLNDASWFQYGSYAVFDRQARNILDRRQSLFWISDPSRTDLIQYPPAFPWLVASIYRITGSHSAYAVQNVVSLIDLILSLVLTVGIAITAYGWRAGMATGILVALSPVLAMVGVTPSADAPTAWCVLAGLWLLIVAAKRSSVWWALAAGATLGVACWLRVNPLYLSVFWAIALLVFVPGTWRKGSLMSAAVLLGAMLVVSPIVVRNYLVFPDFTPTGGTLGANLWEGLGETEFGRSNGFEFGDDKLVERERIKMGLPTDFPIEAMWPDGIKREHERTRESLNFIKQHPVWYAGVVLHRMWGMLKVAGEPLPYYGTAGINVTSRKCLPPAYQGGVLAVFTTGVGMIQSVTRYALLPLTALGIWLAIHRNWPLTSLLLATVVYYLGPGTLAHTEIRYVLPLHAVLPIFAGLSLCYFGEMIHTGYRRFANRGLHTNA
jgi:4-amino-4-deoxy-L-arabinose transferase-like glycosyltransferase